MSNFCTNCGSQLGTGKFCQNCGAKVEEVGQKAQANIENKQKFEEPIKSEDKPRQDAAKEEQESKVNAESHENHAVNSQENAGQRIKQYKRNNNEILVDLNKKRTQGFWFFVLVIAGLFVIGMIGTAISQGQKAAVVNAKVSAVSKIEKATGVTTQKAKEIVDILEKCEIKIDNIISVAHDESFDNKKGKGEKLYKITTFDLDEVEIRIYSNGILDIYWIGNVLYENGKVVARVSDYLLTADEKGDLKNRCQYAIIQTFNLPVTSNFAPIDKWIFYKSVYGIYMGGYVDVNDTNGEIRRKTFTLMLKPDKKTITFFKFDGKEYIS